MLDVQAVRREFPALNESFDGRPAVFFDNPGGTQVHQSVIDAMTDYMIRRNANTHGAFTTSVRSDAVIDEARQAAADLLGAQRDEVVFGNNMTSLAFALSRALAHEVGPGDEVVVTRLDHDANIMPWVRMAEDAGATVRWADVDMETCTLDMDHLRSLINARTKLVAVGYASNAAGTINDVATVIRWAHEAGALAFVDAVQYAPHGPIDVQALGCDFLVSSAYKWYGPHQGVLWGREDLLQTLPVWKLEAAGNDSPNRWETGTQSHEGQAGCIGAVEYLQWVGQEFGGEFRGAAPAGCSARTADLHSAMRAMAAYEESLSERLITGLRAIDGVEIRGITNLERLSHRVPTVSFTRPGLDNTAVARHLADHNVYVWSGHNYALPVVDALGIRDTGVVRVGPTHYNTLEEIDTLLALVADVVAAH